MQESLIATLRVPEKATLRDAMISFNASGLGVVLVSDDRGQLAGIATEGDVRRALLDGHGLISPLFPHANREPFLGHTTMSREELVGMLSEVVHCLPVVDDGGIVRDILFYDTRSVIPVALPSIGERELRYVTDAVLSGWVSSRGKYIGMFEERFAAFCGTAHGVAVSNGTVALHLALAALGIGPGDEVIVPALTFIATANSVTYCGARPVFVDIEPTSWNLDPEQVEAAITPRTRAIMPVHLYGQPCRIDRILEIAEKHKLSVIEDAAEALGAEFDGRRVGSFGHMGCFSFYGNKNITTGEGGAVVTNDARLYEKLRILRDHGMSQTRKYWHDVVGFNYRMTNIQAALGVAQLERWDQISAAKVKISDRYGECTKSEHLMTPPGWPNSLPVCWIFTMMLNQATAQVDRDELLARLARQGVDGRPAFYPIPAMPPYFEPDWASRYPVSAQVSAQGFSLPTYVDMSDKDLDRVVAATLTAVK
jgi:perosamine synthetase